LFRETLFPKPPSALSDWLGDKSIEMEEHNLGGYFRIPMLAGFGNPAKVSGSGFGNPDPECNLNPEQNPDPK
jgi:hypothetical protein